MTQTTDKGSAVVSELRKEYIDLIIRCLTNSIYQDAEYQTISMKSGFRSLLSGILRSLHLELVRKVNPQLRSEGKDWPLSAHTMIGEKRLSHLRVCVEEILAKNVPGDLIETGVWRGGACILMRAILKAYGITDRSIYVADSFQGLPKPTHAVDKQDSGNDFYKDQQLAVSLEQVQANFRAYGLLDDQVRFVKGWFRDTLPLLTVPSFAVIRLDGDLYESTMDGLVNLYPKLSVGGFLIVDDYHIPACKQGVEDYRKKNSITEPIQPIDWAGVYWRRAS